MTSVTEAGIGAAPVAPAGTGIEALVRLLRHSRRLVVLTGAGCSTESGIPDYRDRHGLWKCTPPMQYQEFIGSSAARQRYWARACVGWRHLRAALPGRAHLALARLERAGQVECLITQNVDGLHQRAGSRLVIDLHGRIDAVQCLQCRRSFSRAAVQARLEQLNPRFSRLDAARAPDGDALLEAHSDDFRVVDCEHCAGALKPAVVFFGEAVPADTVTRAYAALDRADALLVVGSSLMVYSGYRFVRRACERGLPVALVNLGVTRADGQVLLKVEDSCGAVLEGLVGSLAA
ncbi:MAG TPA: NAD-dependent protein deacetylase [Steroidobacteraceae bacterium]